MFFNGVVHCCVFSAYVKECDEYAKMLSEAGNHEGTKRMADYYYEGKGVSRDKGLAKDLYYDAASKGNKAAKEKLRKL